MDDELDPTLVDHEPAVHAVHVAIELEPTMLENVPALQEMHPVLMLTPFKEE